MEFSTCLCSNCVVYLLMMMAGCSLSHEAGDQVSACDSMIYCGGLLLDTVQRSGLYPDSKTFVDMTMLHDPASIEVEFQELYDSTGGNVSTEALQTFLQQHFTGPGDELEEWTPPDWKQTPSLYFRLDDPGWQKFTLQLNALWKILGRKVKSDVADHPDRHSLLHVPNPFIIPGDRFREFYYWDSYWIVNGLLLSDMSDTARGVIENFLHMVERFGFVPNGGRVYYTRRSQPPLLTPMVNAYYEVTKDAEFVRKHLPTLEKEYLFWKQRRSVNVTHPTTGELHELARYDVDVNEPRPEGYLEDVTLTANMTKEESGKVFANLASACESGWDFSTRWFEKDILCTIQTNLVIPVDLNVYLGWTERFLAKFYTITDDAEKRELYNNHLSRRQLAIQQMLWNEDEGAWFDLDLRTKQHRLGFYPSNIFPLLVNTYDGDIEGNIAEKVFKYVQKHDLLQYEGGVPTSLVDSGQQWDFPNAWPPLVHLFVEALSKTGLPPAKDMARSLAMKWLKTNSQGFTKHGQMFEKYDVRKVGEPGGGGEYTIQTGFGWTNGVALIFLDKYASSLEPADTPVGEEDGIPAYTTAAAGAAIGVVLLVVVVIAMAMLVYKRNKQKRTRSQEGESQQYTAIKHHES